VEAHEGVKRKLAAILYADVAEYSRLTGEDEEGTHRLLSAYLDLITAIIEKQGGRTVHFAGDAVLAEFSSVVDALACAVEAQRELRKRNEALPEERRLQFRIGINLAEVIVDREEIYGDGVNIAARLEGLAQPGGICISGGVYQQVKNQLALAYEFMGPQEVKNIAEPVPVFQVQWDPGVVGKRRDKGVRPLRWRSVAFAAAVVLLVGAGAVAFWNFYPRSSAPPAAPENAAPKLPGKPSIAVLPFENMSDDPGQEHFSDGLTEDIITDLSQLEDLIVIARASVFTYKGKPVKVQQVARELGVQYVLEGSVRKSGDRVRITAQLVDGMTGHHLWADRYDRDLKDVFALQDEIAQKIRATLAGYAVKTAKGSAARDRYEAIGTVVSIHPEKSRIVLDHEEIKDLMAPMVMSYIVTPATLLQGLAKGDKVHFTIDADKRVIVGIVPVGK
jgi:TolB-like protein/class 3 adenylate cyclase